MAKQKVSSEFVLYSKDGRPDRRVYTPADKVQAEWEGFAPKDTKAAKAAENLSPTSQDQTRQK